MSAPPAIELRLPNPWRRIGEEWPLVPIVRTELASRYLHAETRWKGGRPVAVLLNNRLTQRQARCAVAHECEHLDRGQPCGSLERQIERRVRTATARYLLPDLHAVSDVLAVYDLRHAAEELWVTYGVLVDRLSSLTDAEAATISSVVGARQL